MISGLDIKKMASVFCQIAQNQDPCEMHIEQAVLDRVPKMDRPDYEFPASAPVFLEGYNIMNENQSPKAIPIVLTSTAAGRRFGIALVFYEDLRDYVRVMQEAAPHFFDIEDDDFEELKKENLDMNPDRMIIEDRNRVGTITEDDRESLSANRYQKASIFLRSIGEDINKEKLFKGKDYYIPKSIILLSELPIFETLEQIVRHIYRQCVTGIDYPIDSYLSYLTHSAPLPSIGTTITYSFPNLDTFTVENKLLNELPAAPTSFYSEFFTKSILNMNNFYDLLYWFMCQLGSTVFISSSANKIVMSTEVVRTIIFPFDYDDTYVPFLSSALINYLEAPFPVLMGMTVTDEEQLTEIYEIASNKTMFVLLDEDELMVKLSNQIITMKDFKQASEITEENVKITYANKDLPMKKK